MRANPKEIVALLQAGLTAKEVPDASASAATLPELNGKYQDWLCVYDRERPHHGLDLRTPFQMLP